MSESRRPYDAAEDEREIGLMELIAIPIRRWRVVAAVLAIALSAGLLFVIVRSPTYAARTVLVPVAEPHTSRAAVAGGQLMGGLTNLVAAGNPNEKLVGAVLRSRSLEDSVVARVAVPAGGGFSAESEVRRLVRRQMRVQRNSDGSIVIDVRDRDPARVVRIVTEIPDIANSILGDVVRRAALQRQSFLESQVQRAGADLELAESRLIEFQQTQDLPELQEQARQTLEAAAELQQRIIEQEIVLARLRRTATPDNPELRAAVAELDARRTQLRRLTEGGERSEIFLSLRRSPELRALATSMLREYTRHEQLYLSLSVALSEAQLDVQNQLPVITVLDPAVPPGGPSNIPAPYALLLAGLLGLALGGVAAYVKEFVDRASRTDGGEVLREAWGQLRTDVGARFRPRSPARERGS